MRSVRIQQEGKLLEDTMAEMNAVVDMKRAQTNKQLVQQMKKEDAERRMLARADEDKERESDDEDENGECTSRGPKRH